jgi:hypothetical protein
MSVLVDFALLPAALPGEAPPNRGRARSRGPNRTPRAERSPALPQRRLRSLVGEVPRGVAAPGIGDTRGCFFQGQGVSLP